MGLSSLATTVDIDALRNAGGTVAARFAEPYAESLARLPTGRVAFHGIPFDLGSAPSGRWILVGDAVEIQLPPAGPASHLVIAHLCDAWRADDGHRPRGFAIGQSAPIGQPLARYTVIDRAGEAASRVIRRRFEVNEGLIGWGAAAYLAVPHLEHEVLDWRGPHPAQSSGRYSPPGESGALTIMPGTYGGNQVGMTDFVPSPTRDALLWLFALPLGGLGEPARLRLEAIAAPRLGSEVLVAAVTLFAGTANPFRRSPRVSVRLDGVAPGTMDVDLGAVIRTRASTPGTAGVAVAGWGAPRHEARPESGASIVDLATAPDAVLRIDELQIPASELVEGGHFRTPGNGTLVVLPAARIAVDVRILDGGSGEPIPARVRFTAADGRYLPPRGHRDEVNPGFFEDTGGDLLLGSAAYAYVPGEFEIDLPPGAVAMEVVAGFDRTPVVTELEVSPGLGPVEVRLPRLTDLRDRGWIGADTHVHFLAPSTALLQAAAEDVDLVNLLATQWGDLFTNVTDLPWGSMASPAGDRLVVVGTENRQNHLGHLALLGARRPVTPYASGGPPEGRMAGALDVLLADWADRCHADGGLVVAAHFPLPYAEIAADIVSGRIDALEAQTLSEGLDDPMIAEWYRFLGLGDRLPVVGGTDKMSSEIPVGAIRAYARLDGDGPLTYERWAAAVVSGRTFVTSGPLLELSVDGHEPGDVIRLAGAGTLEAVVSARSAQPVIDVVELVVNGRVVDLLAAPDEAGVSALTLRTSLHLDAGSWIAARARSRRTIPSAFETAMAAHTSPVYVEVAGRPIRPSAAAATEVAAIIEGARSWISELAPVADPANRARMVGVLDASLERLRARLTVP